MTELQLLVALTLRYPGRCFVFGVAPVLAVVVQLSLALYHGFTLALPATFALVGGVPVTMRHQLAQSTGNTRTEQRVSTTANARRGSGAVVVRLVGTSAGRGHVQDVEVDCDQSSECHEDGDGLPFASRPGGDAHDRPQQ